jgi:hypothetical protein
MSLDIRKAVRPIAVVALALGLAMLPGTASSARSTASASRTASESNSPALVSSGGVLVPRRVRIIIGFVQTLPA